jgi:hypothetical protein
MATDFNYTVSDNTPPTYLSLEWAAGQPITDLLPSRYERSTTAIVPYVPTRTRYNPPPTASGAILLIGGLAVLALALSHIGGGTHAQAVAWAFVVAAVLAALRKWA